MTRASLIPGRLTRFIGRCWRDTRGAILPYVTVMLVAIVGIALLALDGARYMTLQSELQGAADALALAGAAELDRLPDAEARAVNAIATLVANSPLPGLGGRGRVRVASIQFYSELPAGDASPMSAGVPATNSLDARFVAVALEPAAMNTILPAAVFGGSGKVSTGASAVAGFDQVVCDITPLFVCNPFETEDMDYEQATRALQLAAAAPPMQRRLIRMRQNSGETGQYSPGDYGFLDTPALGGSNAALIDNLARIHRSACFANAASVSGQAPCPRSAKDLMSGLISTRGRWPATAPTATIIRRKTYAKAMSALVSAKTRVAPFQAPTGLSGLRRTRPRACP